MSGGVTIAVAFATGGGIVVETATATRHPRQLGDHIVIAIAVEIAEDKRQQHFRAVLLPSPRPEVF